jgi:hypothetical protein
MDPQEGGESSPSSPHHLITSSALVCLLFALPLLTGCSTRFLRGRAERRIAQKLDDLIGPAERYEVRVRGTKDSEIVVGRIRHIEIDGWNINAGHQIQLESLHMDMRNLRYRAGPDEQLSVGDSALVIYLTEAALNDYLRRQHPDSQPEVALNGGTVTFKGSMRFLGVPTPLVTTGRLEIDDRTRVMFRAEQVTLANGPVPGFGPEYVERHLNPLLNVVQLHLPLRLDSIEVQPGRMVVRGAAFIPPRPKTQ